MVGDVDDPLFELRDVTFRYPDDTLVFDRINTEISDGEFRVLLAPNGGGKSTFMKLLCGLLEPDEGEVLYRGTPVKEFSDEELYSKMGFVFQNPDDQLFGATVKEDIAFGPRNLGMSEDEVACRVDQALNDVELDIDTGKPVHRLSFGQRKRVALAGVLAMGVDTLLLDEPTGELDPLSQQNIFGLIKELNRDRGNTIVAATHHIDLLGAPFENLCVFPGSDRVVEGPPKKIFNDEELLQSASLRPPIAQTVSRELLEHGGLEAMHAEEAEEDLWDFLEEHFFNNL
ncbi:MAG: energy-coupling factor ABC transporter ATP-binding protein [bacterium]